jgi:AraC-like DNA-binding protein
MHSSTYAFDSTWRLLLKDLGVDTGRVLRRADLPEDLLARSALRLEAARFHRFWDSLAAEVGEHLLPVRVCAAVRSEAFSPPLFAALCSPDFLVAAQRIARFKTLVAPMRLTVREDRQQRRVTLDLSWPDLAHPPPPSLVLTELLFLVALGRMGTRERLQPLRATTALPPADLTAYVEFLGVRIEQGDRNELEFDLADARRPFLTSSDALWATFEPELRRRLAQLDASVTVGQRVRAALLEALPSARADIDSVARTLAMSRRSLQRHLESEGISFKQLLQDTRRSLAQHYLRKTEIPAAEISFLLGFEESNSFFRAFRAWTGRTPDSVRKEARSAS